MAGGGGGTESGEPEFQIAPMIDVLLVILIFFMTITSAKVLKVDKTIDLPVAPHAQKRDDERSEAIINVRWDSAAKKAVFVFEDKLHARAAELLEPLRAARTAGEARIAQRQNPVFRAVIRGDESAPALHISQAMNVCAEAGISDISFSSVNRK